jgi:hypothetical protein
MTISRSQRETILTRIQRLVAEKYFDPNFDDSAWNGIVERHRRTIVDAETEGAFENSVAAMLAEMAPSLSHCYQTARSLRRQMQSTRAFRYGPLTVNRLGSLKMSFLEELPQGRVSKLAMFFCRLAVGLSIHLFLQAPPRILKFNKASQLLFCAAILLRN